MSPPNEILLKRRVDFNLRRFGGWTAACRRGPSLCSHPAGVAEFVEFVEFVGFVEFVEFVGFG
jgi:hypothetical protein